MEKTKQNFLTILTIIKFITLLIKKLLIDNDK